MKSRRLIASSQGQGSRIKYSSLGPDSGPIITAKSGPLEFSHDVTSSQDRHTDKRPACRVTSARTSSAPCPWACRSPPRQKKLLCCCCRHLRSRRPSIFFPDHPHATNGPIAFYAMALVNLRRINRWADRSTMLRGLIAFCLLRRALVLIAFAAFLGLGLVAFTALNIEAYPDPAPPIVEIIAQRPGQSPEEM